MTPSYSRVTNYWPYSNSYVPYSTHGDIRSFCFVNYGSFDGKSDEILVGSDGGILYSNSALPNYNNVIWKDCNGDLSINEFYGLTEREDPTTEMTAGGTQDDGMFTRNASGTWLNTVNGAVNDAYEVIHYDVPVTSGVMIGQSTNPSLAKTNNGGVTWGPFGSAPTTTVNWEAFDKVFTKDKLHNIYLGTDDIYISYSRD